MLFSPMYHLRAKPLHKELRQKGERAIFVKTDVSQADEVERNGSRDIARIWSIKHFCITTQEFWSSVM